MFDPKQMYLAKTIYGKLAYVISIHIILVYIFSFFFISRIFLNLYCFLCPCQVHISLYDVLILIQAIVTTVAHTNLNLQLPPYRGMNDW